jgi:hypothetical protein
MIRATLIFLRFFVFFLASILEVQVHANSSIVLLQKQDELYQEPDNCLVESSVCAVKTAAGRKYELTVNKSKVTLGSDSILVRLGLDSIQLVQGSVAIETIGSLKIETEYGTILSADGKLWLSHESDRILVRSLSGTANIQKRGSHDDLPLPAGFEIRIGGVSKKGVASSTVPTVMDLTDHIRRASRLFAGTKKEFRKELQKLSVIVDHAAVIASQLAESWVEREIAAVTAEQERREKVRKNFEAESIRLRQLFRERLNR